MGFQTFTCGGNLGKDPEVYEKGDTKITKFSVGVNVYKGQKNGKPEYKTEWFDVKVFGKGADFAAKLKKGDEIVVLNGEFNTETWEGKNGTQSRRVVNIGMKGSIEKVGGTRSGGNDNGGGNRNSGGNSGGGNNSGGYSNNSQDDQEEEIPF